MSISDLQNDTRRPKPNTPLSDLMSRSEQPPFRQLCEWILNNSASSESFILNETSQPALLNAIFNHLHPNNAYKFAHQPVTAPDSRGYEQIIYEDRQIPTRSNWHDLFNGLIWSQFPQTKATLNRIHYQQIQQWGNKKRTLIRDRLTHFDECGLVLFTSNSDVQSLLQQHHWQSLFLQRKDAWHSTVVPVIFGHALWEMLMLPFIGLTAKATVVKLSPKKLDRLYSPQAGIIDYAYGDELLCEHLQNLDLKSKQNPWLPLPLLGIPSWSPFAQTEAFYSNQDYFMPSRNSIQSGK